MRCFSQSFLFSLTRVLHIQPKSMLNMNNFQEQCVSVYEKTCNAPVLDSVCVTKNRFKQEFQWRAKWSQRDMSRNSKINFTSNGILMNNDGDLLPTISPFTAEIKNEKLISISPSGDLTAKLLEINIKSQKHHFLEIWKDTQKISSLDLTEEKKHGVVHANFTFGCLNWSHDSSKLVYVAEKKQPTTKSYFEKTDGHTTQGNQFVYKENWGEDLTEAYDPTLFVYDVKSKMITDLSESFSDVASLGTALWSHDDTCLYVLAWKSTPWKLGLFTGKNRFSTIYELELETKNLTNLTDGNSCAFSLVLSSDGKSLFYLQNEALGPHRQSSKLMRINLQKLQPPKVTVDEVQRQANCKKFQGFYLDKIIKNCWLNDGKRLLLQSTHRSNIGILCVNVETGNVTVLESEGAWKVLNVCDNILFVSYSTPNTPTVFRAGIFNPNKINWIDIEVPVPAMNDIKWTVQKHEPCEKNDEYPDLDYESILVTPSHGKTDQGLIVNPHGGPHSNYFASFDIFTACFARLGFAVLRINYRGSVGFGKDSIMSVISRVGVQDVSDVHNAAEQAVRDLHIPPGKVFVTGGSLGGFTALHLLSKYPEFYAACATTNPVTNLAIQQSTTDIMDWCFSICGSKFSFTCVPSPEVVRKFLECSPIMHVEKVKAPVLFLLGSIDLRVPPSQSFEFVRCLKSLGRTVSVLKYDNNNHPISNVNAESDCFVNTARWFHDYGM